MSLISSLKFTFRAGGFAVLALLGLAGCGQMSTAQASHGTDTVVAEDFTGSSPDYSNEISSVSNHESQPTESSSKSGCAANIDGSRVDVCELVNADRAKAGLAPLQIDARLNAVAQAFAQDMYSRGFFGHVTPTGGTMDDRMRAGGINYGWAGENIAQGQRSPAEVNTSWMNSPGHRANILNTHYRKVGIGYVGDYWVQEFSD